MHEHNGWSFISLVTVGGQVRIEHQVLLLLYHLVKSLTILDVIDHLYLVICKDRVNEAAWSHVK